MDKGPDFILADDLGTLVRKMNDLAGNDLTMKQSNMKLKLATYKLIIHLLKIHKSHLSIMHVNS